ncbi:MAG: DUF4157 domain-containing protein [Cyanobacteria bacterium P01_G01_bin.54]
MTASGGTGGIVQRQEEERKPNKTGLPDRLKDGIEQMSGYDLSDVRVNYNSPKPAQVNALAYTQGTAIEVAPGQERHLPHEAWHVVQQMQGRVRKTKEVKGVAVNDENSLEKEAEERGKRLMEVTRAKSVEAQESQGKDIEERGVIEPGEKSRAAMAREERARERDDKGEGRKGTRNQQEIVRAQEKTERKAKPSQGEGGEAKGRTYEEARKGGGTGRKAGSVPESLRCRQLYKISYEPPMGKVYEYAYPNEGIVGTMRVGQGAQLEFKQGERFAGSSADTRLRDHFYDAYTNITQAHLISARLGGSGRSANYFPTSAAMNDNHARVEHHVMNMVQSGMRGTEYMYRVQVQGKYIGKHGKLEPTKIEERVKFLVSFFSKRPEDQKYRQEFEIRVGSDGNHNLFTKQRAVINAGGGGHEKVYEPRYKNFIDEAEGKGIQMEAKKTKYADPQGELFTAPSMLVPRKTSIIKDSSGDVIKEEAEDSFFTLSDLGKSGDRRKEYKDRMEAEEKLAFENVGQGVTMKYFTQQKEAVKVIAAASPIYGPYIAKVFDDYPEPQKKIKKQGGVYSAKIPKAASDVEDFVVEMNTIHPGTLKLTQDAQEYEVVFAEPFAKHGK